MFAFTVPAIAASLVLLVIRIILSVAFFTAARSKFKDIKAFAKNDGLPVPVAYFVAVAEFAAALGMLSGVLAQWAGLGLILIMTTAIGIHIFKWHTPYWASKGGWEYDLILLALAAAIVTFGAGQFALSL